MTSRLTEEPTEFWAVFRRDDPSFRLTEWTENKRYAIDAAYWLQAQQKIDTFVQNFDSYRKRRK